MKGIIMGAGTASRLYPATKAVNKHFLPVYDKPMLYYPLALLMMAGIRDITLGINRADEELCRNLLSDGSRLGLRISYHIEEPRRGAAGAFLLGQEMPGSESVAIALADNVVFGSGIAQTFRDAADRFEKSGGAKIFCSYVEHPQDFGVIRLNREGRLLSLESRSPAPVSNYAVTGLFFFEKEAFGLIKNVNGPVDGNNQLRQVLRQYLREGKLHHQILDRKIRWFDAGRPDRVLEAALAVKDFQEKHGAYAGCIEEIAYDNGWISRQQLQKLAAEMPDTEYGKYLEGRCAEQAQSVLQAPHFICG